MMSLPDAIRLGAMNAPQGYGRLLTIQRSLTLQPGLEHPGVLIKRSTCALGAACDALGMLATPQFPYGPPTSDRAIDELEALYPQLLTVDVPCPACGDGDRILLSIIVHLNDDHRWTRERIADWVETLETPVEVGSEPVLATV